MTTYRFTLENGMEYSANAATMKDAIAYGKNKFTCIFSVQVDPTQSDHHSLDTARRKRNPSTTDGRTGRHGKSSCGLTTKNNSTG